MNELAFEVPFATQPTLVRHRSPSRISAQQCVTSGHIREMAQIEGMVEKTAQTAISQILLHY
jgi:hypothetical protein